VAGENREGQELSRRIRDELERIRDAEGRVEDALESVRQARRRVEVIARELGREETRVRALVREELRASGASLPPGSCPGVAELLPDEESALPSSDPRSWRSDPAVGWSRRPPAPEADALPVPSALPEPIRVDVPVLAPPRARADRADDVPLPDTRVADRWTAPGGRLIGIGLAAVLAVSLVGWLAIRGLQRTGPTGPQPGATAPAPAPTVPLVDAPPEAAPAGPTSVLAALPTDPVARTALYDSLAAAHSPLFDPLLAAVEADSDDDAIERALESWREGDVDVQEGDLLHSAFVQEALKLRTGRLLEIDGQLLRNPCRGGSCTALLELWRTQRERYGFPEVPSDAATNTTALRQVEAALVLDWMKEANAAVR